MRPPGPEYVHDNPRRPTGECGSIPDKVSLLVGLRFITEVGVAAKVRLAALGDLIPSAVFDDHLNEPCFLQLGKPSLDGRVRDARVFCFQVEFQRFLIEDSTALREELKDGIVATSHPFGSESAWHNSSSFRPKIIPPNSYSFGQLSTHFECISTQTYFIMAKYLFTTADASLPRASFTRENGCAAVSPARTARWPHASMTDPRSGLKTPERSDRRSERLTDCPVCGRPVDGLAADDRTTIEPCGHSAAGFTITTMTTDTTSDANRVMTDGGQTQDEQVLVVFQTYEDDADLETNGAGNITNHDELVDAGQTYREIRYLSAHAVESFDLTVVDEDHPLWCDAVAEMDHDDVLRVDELRGEGDD